MPEDQKKNADKKKHDPKEQRKPRHSRNQPGKSDRRAERIEEVKAMPKISVPQKPVYEDPGPEFYKNLKRETEEIVKITEAENAKYRKKEIQSNWAKYEMPIQSYEDLDEQDPGADYEKLIQAPLSAGNHFQFKHEKTWVTSTAPSLYDKYFEINMDNLAIAVSTIPFYERNDIDQSEFSETDLLSMNSRASKYKLKYFNDKTFSTPETEAQDKIIKKLKENLNLKDSKNDQIESEKGEIDGRPDKYEVNLDFNAPIKTDVTCAFSNKTNQENKSNENDKVDDFDDEFIFKDVPHDKIIYTIPEATKAEVKKDAVIQSEVEPPKAALDSENVKVTEPTNVALLEGHPVTSKIDPVIQSPEDLEKWLDDFLDS